MATAADVDFGDNENDLPELKPSGGSHTILFDVASMRSSVPLGPHPDQLADDSDLQRESDDQHVRMPYVNNVWNKRFSSSHQSKQVHGSMDPSSAIICVLCGPRIVFCSCPLTT
jgi:hypothetical protein